MTEWWSYRLASFLMFAPDVYWRLVQRYNEAWWPGQFAGVAAALGIPLLLRQGSSQASRAALVLVALAWAWAGWAFEGQRYAEIFIAAPAIGAAFGVEAVALLAACAWRPGPARGVPGIAWLLLGAALLYPLLAPLTGHAWVQAEVFGFMPDPTAVGTVGVLVALRAWPRWVRAVLAVLPGMTLLLGAATRSLLAQ